MAEQRARPMSRATPATAAGATAATSGCRTTVSRAHGQVHAHRVHWGTDLKAADTASRNCWTAKPALPTATVFMTTAKGIAAAST